MAVPLDTHEAIRALMRVCDTDYLIHSPPAVTPPRNVRLSKMLGASKQVALQRGACAHLMLVTPEWLNP